MLSSLSAFIESKKEILCDYILLIVCNTKSEVCVKSNYEGFDVATEYLSDVEFEQVISIFNQCRIKDIRIFQNEYSFIDYILKNRTVINKEKIIVYSSAQSGTGAGRKSLIPAFCKLEGIPCTGSNPYVVSLCRQKYHVNKLLASASIPVPTTYLYDNGWLFNQIPLQYEEILLKPIYESASIGIDSDSLKQYTSMLDSEIQKRNSKMRQPIIAQQFISGYEVEYPVYITKQNIFPLLPIGLSFSPKEQLMGKRFLNYEDIYFDNYFFYNFEQNENYNKQIIEAVRKAVTILGMHGLCRVDFRVEDQKHFYITDVSTNPHFISHSSVYTAFQMLGLPEQSIAESILLSALQGE